jgi:hypothetical protein
MQEEEAIEGLMILKYGASWRTQSKKNLQQERLHNLHLKISASTQVSRGVYTVEIEPEDDARNYEELFIAETKLLPYKVTRSGRRR